MHIQIVKFQYPNQDLPALNHFEDDKVNKLFVKVSEANTEDQSHAQAVVYLGEKTAVLKIIKQDADGNTNDIRFFLYSINTQISTDAIAIFTLFNSDSAIKEGRLNFTKL